MSDLAGFAVECRAASRGLRALPADLRRAISAQVKPQIAVPLAGAVGSAAAGPWARALSGSVKARASAEPVIVVGGARRVVSGGASARQLVYGTEFGGGSRVALIPASPGRRAHRRHSTRQFAANRSPFVFPTLARQGGWVLDRFADIVDDVLGDGG